MSRKVLLIHGYSDGGASFYSWAAKLQQRKIDAAAISICNYVTLNNEVTIPDIAEGLDRAIQSLGWPVDQDFDAIVHSTGMLVIRAWLSNNRARARYLKHLVGLAPATWGSPLAHLGRSFLAAIVHGNHQFGPDFLAAGDSVLDALELGSKFTWDLAHHDLLGETPVFTKDEGTPYVAVFIGNQGYAGIKELANTPGTDGTVRWAGCALNSRKLIIDLRRPGTADTQAQLVNWPPNRLSIPMFAVEGKDHGTLLVAPEDDLANRIADFFQVDSAESFNRWLEATQHWASNSLQKMKNNSDGWQQFVVRVVDEHGDPVPDFVVDLFTADPSNTAPADLAKADVDAFDREVHTYSADQSYRCFHVQLPAGIVKHAPPALWLRLSASSGSDFIQYCGYRETAGGVSIDPGSPVVLNLSHLTVGTDGLFCPFTTTLVEITLNRQPTTKVMAINPFPGSGK